MFLIGIVAWFFVGAILLINFNILYTGIEWGAGIFVALLFNEKLSSWLIRDSNVQEKIKLLQNYEKMKQSLITQYYKRKKCTSEESLQIEKQLSIIQEKQDDLARRIQENFEKQCEAQSKIEKLKAGFANEF